MLRINWAFTENMGTMHKKPHKSGRNISDHSIILAKTIERRINAMKYER